jgi:hypothetical protein
MISGARLYRILGIAAVMVLALGCSSRGVFAQQARFDDPRTPRGNYVDRCLQWAQQCDDNNMGPGGKHAAHALCWKMCYANAVDSKWSYKAPTEVIMGGQICNDPRGCGGIDYVICERKLRPCMPDSWVTE